jgi:hypothetical protein
MLPNVNRITTTASMIRWCNSRKADVETFRKSPSVNAQEDEVASFLINTVIVAIYDMK